MNSKPFPRWRNIDLEICVRKNDFEILVTELESGITKHMVHPFSPDEHPEFDKAIGDEIYSWLCLWKDEEESEDESE